MPFLFASAPARTGLTIALVVSAFAFGFRHGIDWDHIAAITDITSSQRSVRTGLRFATLYAAGHGFVVFVIGVLAIAARESLPDSVDTTMERVVGVTLLVLGVYVLYALLRYRRDFRLRSRWMLIFESVVRLYRWVRERVGRPVEVVEHEHVHVSAHVYAHHEGDDVAPVAPSQTHSHRHKHADPFMNYGTGTSLAVGMLHGVGAETPTQVVIFLAAAGAGGVGAGVLVLAVFLLGLFASNSVLALASATGFLAATKRFAVYATVSLVTAVASLVIGTAFVLGKTSFLPALFGG